MSIVEYTGADFGIRGDGESAIVALMRELRQGRRFDQVPGLIWREDGQIRRNMPAWPEQISLATSRDTIDNLSYFQQGGQCGIETKRGCNRSCIYCADPIAGDQRFFEPAIEVEQEKTGGGNPTDYNYNQNLPLIQAIKEGARGAYWDILRQMRD